MENVLGYLGAAVIAPFHLTHLARKSLAERTTNKYLQTVTDASLLADLSNALEPLLHDLSHVEQIFDKFAVKTAHGERHWNKLCFVDFISATYGGAQTIGPSTTLLWQYFSSAAYFPLGGSSPSQTSDEGSILDFGAFKRAFALLPLQGVELLGYGQIRGGLDHKYEFKVPKIARLIVSCATQREKAAASEPRMRTEENVQDMTMDNVSDVISFAQPQTYESYPYGPRVPEEHFKDASRRVVSLARNRPAYTAVIPKIQRSDLQSLLQLSMLVSLQDRRWRTGLEMPIGMGYTKQKSADIQYSRLMLSPDTVSQGSELAASVSAHSFINKDGNVLYSTFEQYLMENIWASIFAPTPSRQDTKSNLNSRLPISISNSISLLNVAKFLHLDQPRARYLQNELQFNVDLQASSLVLDTADPSTRTRAAIEAALATDSHFHVVLIRGQGVSSASFGNSLNDNGKLMAIFVAPQGPKMQIWRERDEEQSNVQYVWRSSFIQLLPEVIRADAGPLSIVDGGVEGGNELLLRAHSTEDSDGVSVPSIRLDVANGTLDASNLMKEGAITTLRWTSLQCYRMPGKACPVTYSP